MSKALYKHGGLRFWSEAEIEMREFATRRIAQRIRETLIGINGAWRFSRVEGPCLSPRDKISASYSDDDIFVTNHKDFCLRAETTPTSYAWARHDGGKMPLCVWQLGKSFRRETNDGASAAKLRFNEFYQLEFQCIYRADTKADYRAALIESVQQEIAWFTHSATRTIESDRLPSYSESTIDIDANHAGKWREIASCSIRTDFSPDIRVAEIAIGIDRLVTLAMHEKETT